MQQQRAWVAGKLVLRNQIGKYGISPRDVTKNNPLESGIAEYEAAHESKVRAFEQKFGRSADKSTPAASDSQYFRKLFVRFIEKLEQDEHKENKGDLGLRKTNPKEAAVKMENFFGKYGTELYKLALEEEMNSREYMAAVYQNSTEKFPGPKWAERPIIPVSGPSASGKTTAAKKAIEEASQFLKKTNEDGENTVIFVDGGKARETSQMMKLAIIAANNKGYTGIRDIHSKSKVLNGVKKRIYNYALHHTEHGVVIPETFSHFLNPFDRTRKMLKEISKVPNSKTIFVRIKGKDKSLFKDLVAYWGSSRAWKTDGFDKQQPLSFRAKTSESKAYGASGFRFGVKGSKLAEKWFKENNKDSLSMIITNDVVFKKETPPEGSNNWKQASANDKHIVVSERLFKQWQEYKIDWETNKEKGIPQDAFLNLHDYNNKHQKTLVHTSNSVKILKAAEKISKLDFAKYNDDKLFQNQLKNLKKQLNEIELDNPEKIKNLAKYLKLIKIDKKEYPQEHKELEKLQKALDVRIKELELIQANKENKQANKEDKQESPSYRSPAPLSAKPRASSSTTTFLSRVFNISPSQVRAKTSPANEMPRSAAEESKQATLSANASNTQKNTNTDTPAANKPQEPETAPAPAPARLYRPRI